MNANIIDGETCVIKQIVQYESYSFAWDIDFTEQSSITVFEEPLIATGDFVVCFDASGKVAYQGICIGVGEADGTASYTINMKQMEALFDREIILTGASIAKTTGIEDFLASIISAEFINSGDPILDHGYMTVTAQTHTLYKRKIETEEGIFNLKTFIGNLRQNNGIYTTFSFSGNTLRVRISKPEQPVYRLDIRHGGDVAETRETYNVDILAHLDVLWKIPDDSSDDVIGATTRIAYYFTAGRNITRDINAADRVIGEISASHYQAESYDALMESVTDEFANRNTYEHQVDAWIYAGSKAYPYSDMVLGKRVTIRARSRTVSSIVMRIARQSGSPLYQVRFGKLPVKLTDKIRRPGR